MTISAIRDANRIPVAMATLNTDGVTPVALVVNSANHTMRYSDGTTGSSIASSSIQRDANRVPALWGVSSADGKTLIPIYCNSSGQILTKST